MFDDYIGGIHKEYFNNYNKWQIEEDILFSFSKKELKKLIKETKESYFHDNLKYTYSLARKQLSPLYKRLSDIDKHFLKQYEYIFHGGEDLQKTKDFISRIDNFYKLNYTKQYKNKFKYIDIKSINIKDVVNMYIKLPDNLRRNIRCIFPDHRDTLAKYENIGKG